MRIEKIQVKGYRSLRDMQTELDWLTVLVGPNGVGKSNLYRSLQLLDRAADRQLARAVAAEGGMGSVRWAGEGASGSLALKINVRWDELEYEMELGVEIASSDLPASFPHDPFIRKEKIWSRLGRRVEMIRRGGPLLQFRDDEGKWQKYRHNLDYNESMLSQIREPSRFPSIVAVRNEIASWRFFHGFRSDDDSPLRRPQPVYRTTTMDSDGSNLVAALLTIQGGKNAAMLKKILKRALPEASLQIQGNSRDPLREIGMKYSAVKRTLGGHEISDGTLRFFALAAALLSEEQPELLVLNEPETALHESTFPALADAIVFAAESAQVLVVSHSNQLAKEIAWRHETKVRTLNWDQKLGTRIDTQAPKIVVRRGKATAEELDEVD